MTAPKRASLFDGRGDSDELLADAEDCDAIDANAASASPAALVRAEVGVVASIIAHNAIHGEVADVIRAEDFSDEKARALFGAVAEILDGEVEGVERADVLTVALQPGVVGVASLEDVQRLVDDAACDDAVTVLGWAHLIQQASAHRRLKTSVDKAAAIVDEGISFEAKAHAIQQLVDGVDAHRRLPVVGLGSAVRQALLDLAEQAQQGAPALGIPTGIEGLDALTGGLHPGQLIVVAGRPGMGKTALAMTFGLNAANGGYQATMLSMEMIAAELSKRALAIESGVDSHAIRLGALHETEWVAVVDAAERLAEIPFDIVDDDDVGLAKLIALAKSLRRAGRLDLLVVDYLQIMETGASKQNREQSIADITRSLKKLAKALGIPIVLLSQLNRALEARVDKRPQLGDLRESGAIEQDADVVIFVYREDMYSKAPAADVVPAELIVAKQRGGATGVVEALFRRSTTHYFGPERLAAGGGANESPSPSPTALPLAA